MTQRIHDQKCRKNDKRMKLIRQGSGPAPVFQHGFLSGAGYWKKQFDYFSRSFDVIATNLPGYGNNAESLPLDRIQDHALFVLNLMNELKIKSFSLVGHSMGGMIAQEIAIIAANRIEKLVLFGTGPNGLLPGRFESIADSELRVERDGKQKTINTTVASWFLNREAHSDFSGCLNLAMKTSESTMLAGYSAWEKWSAVERLDKISSETLIVWGGIDLILEIRLINYWRAY